MAFTQSSPADAAVAMASTSSFCDFCRFRRAASWAACLGRSCVCWAFGTIPMHTYIIVSSYFQQGMIKHGSFMSHIYFLANLFQDMFMLLCPWSELASTFPQAVFFPPRNWMTGRTSCTVAMASQCCQVQTQTHCLVCSNSRCSIILTRHPPNPPPIIPHIILSLPCFLTIPKVLIFSPHSVLSASLAPGPSPPAAPRPRRSPRCAARRPPPAPPGPPWRRPRRPSAPRGGRVWWFGGQRFEWNHWGS